MKAKEKEMKEEKEAERQVREALGSPFSCRAVELTTTEPHSGDQRQARGKGREGAIRENGREDAQEENREAETEREKEQVAQLMSIRDLPFTSHILLRLTPMQCGFHPQP